MSYAVMTHGLFELDDTYDQNDIRLTKDMTKLKDNFKVQNDKME